MKQKDNVKQNYEEYHFSKTEILKYLLQSILLCSVMDYLFYQNWWLLILAVPVTVLFMRLKKKGLIRERKRNLNYQFKDALNALSEEASLFVMPPHRNMYLVGAIVGSFVAHFAILYIPFLASIFSVAPLTLHDWMIVLAFSFPVIVIDEVLKCFSRYNTRRQLEKRLRERKEE